MATGPDHDADDADPWDSLAADADDPSASLADDADPWDSFGKDPPADDTPGR